MKRPPYKFDNKKKVKWLELYKKSGSFTSACNGIGISRQTAYDQLKTDKKFLDKKTEVDEIVNDVVESRAFKMTENFPVMAIWWLCNRRKDRWQSIQHVEHGFDPDKPLGIKFIPADDYVKKSMKKKANGK